MVDQVRLLHRTAEGRGDGGRKRGGRCRKAPQPCSPPWRRSRRAPRRIRAEHVGALSGRAPQRFAERRNSVGFRRRAGHRVCRHELHDRLPSQPWLQHL